MRFLPKTAAVNLYLPAGRDIKPEQAAAAFLRAIPAAEYPSLREMVVEDEAAIADTLVCALKRDEYDATRPYRPLRA